MPVANVIAFDVTAGKRNPTAIPSGKLCERYCHDKQPDLAHFGAHLIIFTDNEMLMGQSAGVNQRPMAPSNIPVLNQQYS